MQIIKEEACSKTRSFCEGSQYSLEQGLANVNKYERMEQAWCNASTAQKHDSGLFCSFGILKLPINKKSMLFM